MNPIDGRVAFFPTLRLLLLDLSAAARAGESGCGSFAELARPDDRRAERARR
jgi:hypothetical protein